MKLDKQLAWETTEHLLMSIGGISLTAFVLQCHYYLIIIAGIMLPAVWTILYKFEEGIREKWLERFSTRRGAVEKAGETPEIPGRNRTGSPAASFQGFAS